MMLHRMKVTVLSTAFALALGTAAMAHVQDETKCPVAAKLSGLVNDWQQARTADAAIPAAQREAGAKEMSKLATSCPVGSRMGNTLSALRDTFAGVKAIDAELKQHCPLEQPGADPQLCAEAKPMLAAREQILSHLHTLTAQAAESMTCCSAKPGAEACASAPECDGCAIRIASRLGGLKVEWAYATREVNGMPQARRSEILTSFAQIAAANASVRLMPSTMKAINEGLDALNQIEVAMQSWAEKHPELMREIPPAALISFRVREALLNEAREVMSGVNGAMSAMQKTAASTTSSAPVAAR